MKQYTIAFILFFSGILFSEAQDIKIDENTFGGIRARHIGPATMSGRIAAIDAIDEDPNTIYVGAASGGLWKTKNQGITFKSIFDKHIQSIGAIRIDQNHPDTVWVGTGEPWVRNSVSVGNGIYKTTNAGSKWKAMGLEKTERIVRIVIDPKNSNIVYVAALGHLWRQNPERGLFKTTDGGKTWNKILYIDETTGCSDVAIDPQNPNILYAGMWQFHRKAWTFQSGGESSGLYKSTDSGETWTKLTKDLPQTEMGRIALSVSPVDPNIVFALIESEKSGLYKSLDKGTSWEKVNDTKAVTERPFYFANIIADPVDTARVYKPGFSLTVSNDGGRHFSAPYVQGGDVHPDHHALYVSKKDNNILYAGTDGGLYISNDKGNAWRMARNLPVSQFYHVSIDMQKPYNVYGGLQDNGSWYGPSQSSGGITNAKWKSVGMGDGFYVYADKQNNDIIYWQFQGGKFGKFFKSTEEMKLIAPNKDAKSGELRFNWNAPIVFSTDGKRIYVGAQHLFRSEDKGESWSRISDDLTTNNPEKLKQYETGGLTLDNSTAENHCTIITINESPLDKNIIWVGTDDGNLQVTTNAGKTWTNLTANIPNLPSATWCSYVEPSKFNKNRVYVTFDGHKIGDMTPYAFMSDDLGKTWKPLADNNLETYCHVIKEDLVDPNLLFLGTEWGLYVSVNQGKNWARFVNNFPMVSVRDLVIHPREHDLVAATHGRGIFIIDDITPIRKLTNETLNAEVAFLKNRPYFIPDQKMGQAWTGDDEFIGKNPSSTAVISYYMKKRHVFGSMKIEIYNSKGEFIQEIPAGKRKGINIVPWSIKMKPPKVPVSNQLAGFAFQAPNLDPGIYTIKLIKGKKTFETTIELLLNPDSPHSVAHRKERLVHIMKAYNLLEDLAFIDGNAQTVIKKYEELKPKLKKSTQKKYDKLNTQLEEIHKLLVATKEGAITGEEQLREKIAFLYGTMVYYGGKPTQSQINSIDLYVNEEQKYKKQLMKLFNKDLVELNKLIEKEGQAPIKLLTKEEFLKQ